MTDTKWTPGPWRVESAGYGASSAPYEIWAAGSQSFTIALLNGRESPEIAANAALIAAAPDLYEACEQVLGAIEDCGYLISEGLLRDALAKARGEQT